MPDAVESSVSNEFLRFALMVEAKEEGDVAKYNAVRDMAPEELTQALGQGQPDEFAADRSHLIRKQVMNKAGRMVWKWVRRDSPDAEPPENAPEVHGPQPGEKVVGSDGKIETYSEETFAEDHWFSESLPGNAHELFGMSVEEFAAYLNGEQTETFAGDPSKPKPDRPQPKTTLRPGLQWKQVDLRRGGKRWMQVRTEQPPAPKPPKPPSKAEVARQAKAAKTEGKATAEQALNKLVSAPGEFTKDHADALNQHLDKLTGEALKQAIRDMKAKIKLSGPKADLVKRLLEHAKGKVASGEAKPTEKPEPTKPPEPPAPLSPPPDLNKPQPGEKAAPTEPAKPPTPEPKKVKPELEASKLQKPYSKNVKIALGADGRAIHSRDSNPSATQWLEGATANEVKAANKYTEDAYNDLNHSLRETGSPPKKYAALDRQLQKAFARAKPLQPPVNVQRNVNLGDESLEKFLGELRGAMENGSEFVSPSYMSTAAMDKSSQSLATVLLKIKATKGLDLKAISSVPHEEEVLLNRGSKFRVTGIKSVQKTGMYGTPITQYHVEMEQIA